MAKKKDKLLGSFDVLVEKKVRQKATARLESVLKGLFGPIEKDKDLKDIKTDLTKAGQKINCQEAIKEVRIKLAKFKLKLYVGEEIDKFISKIIGQ